MPDIEDLIPILWAGFLIGAVVIGHIYLNRRLVAYYSDKPQFAFRRQLIQLGAVLLSLLIIILLLPVNDTTTGQLLSLFGIIVSATIALSSTTLVGNVMAGLMLRMVNNIKPGDHVSVGDYFGRISEMDLLHVEIQTEERDLTTLPNLFMVQNPVRVMRSSGTILSVEVGLGYDVSRHQIEQRLLEAAAAAGLKKPFVQIVNLGDFAVTYKVSGLLTEINKLIGKRRELRAKTIDALHNDGIEIASPTIMSQRVFDKRDQFVPPISDNTEHQDPLTSPDSLIFDKAAKAESVSKLKEKLGSLQDRYKECEAIAESNDEERAAAASRECEQLKLKMERLERAITQRESQISNS